MDSDSLRQLFQTVLTTPEPSAWSSPEPVLAWVCREWRALFLSENRLWHNLYLSQTATSLVADKATHLRTNKTETQTLLFNICLQRFFTQNSTTFRVAFDKARLRLRALSTPFEQKHFLATLTRVACLQTNVDALSLLLEQEEVVSTVELNYLLRALPFCRLTWSKTIQCTATLLKRLPTQTVDDSLFRSVFTTTPMEAANCEQEKAEWKQNAEVELLWTVLNGRPPPEGFAEGVLLKAIEWAVGARQNAVVLEVVAKLAALVDADALTQAFTQLLQQMDARRSTLNGKKRNDFDRLCEEVFERMPWDRMSADCVQFSCSRAIAVLADPGPLVQTILRKIPPFQLSNPVPSFLLNPNLSQCLRTACNFNKPEAIKALLADPRTVCFMKPSDPREIVENALRWRKSLFKGENRFSALVVLQHFAQHPILEYTDFFSGEKVEVMRP